MLKIKLNRQNLGISILLLSTFLFFVAAGINLVSLPLIIYQKSIPPSLMGISTAVEIAAGVLIARFLHSLSGKIGLFKLMIGFAFLQSLIILIISFYQNFPIWLLLIFFSGLSWFGITTLRQAWVNGLIGDKNRSKILGIFSSVMCGGLTIGPVIVKLIGAGNYLNFVVSASAIFLSCLVLLAIKNHQPKIEKPLFENKIFQIIKKDYRIFLARFLLDFNSIILVIFTVFYGISNNFSAENSGLLVSAYMAIGLFDFVIGFLINAKFYKKYFNIGFSGCIITMLILPWVINNFYAAILIYLMCGWFSSLIFITAMSAANNNQKAGNAVAVNSALQASGSFGSVVGILIAGILIELFGRHGFIISIIFPSALYLITNFLTKDKNEKNSFRG